jgi:hypothetical protein
VDNKLTIPVPKSDLYIFACIGYEEGAVILDVKSVTGSITLEPGEYTITVRGGGGGDGGRAGSDSINPGRDRSYGAGGQYRIIVNTVTELSYWLGNQGGKGGDGSGWSTGGGGGGTSIIVFNTEVEFRDPWFRNLGDYKSVFCWGGHGARGEDEFFRWDSDNPGGLGGGEETGDTLMAIPAKEATTARWAPPVPEEPGAWDIRT